MSKYIQKSRKISLVEFKHSGGSLNVTNTFTNFEIQEDIFKDSVQSKLTLVDAADALNKVDFDGTETFELTFNSPGQEEISMLFQVYKIEVTPDPNSGFGKVYQMFGVTPEHFTQSTTDINKAYNSKISDAVQDVFDTLGTDKPLDIHETSGIDRFIVPGMTPYETYQMLTRRSFDSRYSSSLFTFYENSKGFHFHNIERLIDENRSDAVKYKYTPTSSENNNDPDSQFMIEEISFDSNKDVMYRIKSGSYANQCKKIDLINQTIITNVLLVKENFGDFAHLDDVAMSYDSQELMDRHLNTVNSTRWIHESKSDPSISNNFEALIPRRRFYYDSLKGVRARARIPGNSELTVGTVIDLDMMELSAKTKGKQQEPKISGKWLITQIFHMVDRKEYECILVLNKESYRANVENPEKNVVARG